MGKECHLSEGQRERISIATRLDNSTEANYGWQAAQTVEPVTSYRTQANGDWHTPATGVLYSG